MDKLSYALGMNVGYSYLASGVRNLQVDDFAQGVKAVMEQAEPALSINEAKTIINDFFMKLQEQINKAAGENLKKGEDFLAENAKRPGIVALPSGLQYEILSAGTGRKPSATDRVQCHYHGTLIDGTVFDSSVQRGEPAVFGVNQVIPGWVEALQLMPEGSRWKLYIPSKLAYGEHQAGSIPPNSVLVFEVELIKVI